MAWHGDGGRSGADVDFFISYSPVDELWATWVAWELESAGYTTMLQAWDFVPGSNFIDFMDRGVSRSVAVIAILSSHYIRSTYGRLEWQAAMRRSPDDPASRLITVRIEDFPLEGLLSTITFVDLVPIADRETARHLLLSRVRQAMDGRAKPEKDPGYPRLPGAVAGFIPHVPRRGRPLAGRGSSLPVRPPAAPVRLLHIPGPRFERETAAASPQLQAKRAVAEIDAGLDRALACGAEPPDVLLIGGDLTQHGSIREFDVAREFVRELQTALGMSSRHVAVVPGDHDVNLAACRAYFATCEADEVTPEPPYWPKWRHYIGFLHELRADAGPFEFREEQPWELITVPELRTAVAAINTTMARSHLDVDEHGKIGPRQVRWFADELAGLDGEGWLRVGLSYHHPADIPDGDVLLAHLDIAVAGQRQPGRPGRLITVTPQPGGPSVSTEIREL